MLTLYSELNKSKTVALWGKLAERYKDEVWIGGYDLLNEVNWVLGDRVLRDLYVRITNEIRAVDSDHILFIEGNGFANDFSGLTPPWDSNMVYSPHKYWTYNDTASMQWVLDIREQHNVPLWLGESGENSNVWFTEAINLFEDNNIGWAWWPWKRIETITCPYSINSNSNYEAIIKYWKGEGAKPSIAKAVQGLSKLTTDLLLDNNVYYKDVVDAVLRQPQDETHIPYAEHQIPGIVYLSDYDLGTNGIAYYDSNYANYSLSGEPYEAWNSGWSYRNDGVDIQTSTDNINNNGYQIGYTKDKEWLKYTIDVAEAGFYNLNFRYATPQSGAKVKIFINDTDIAGNISLGNSGGWNNFVNHSIENSYLKSGIQVLKVQVDGNSEFNMSSIEFLNSTTVPSFKELSASTKDDEKSIKLVLSHPLSSQNLAINMFQVKVNNEIVAIESVKADAINNRVINIKLLTYLFYQDAIKLSYSGNDISSMNNSTVLNTFEGLSVDNNLNTRLFIPGKVEAENFSKQVGLATEETSDTGAGKNIGYTDTGDYAEYLIYISKNGYYDISIRSAAESNEGKIEFELINNGITQSISAVDLPVTGGWQSWQTTTTAQTFLNKGVYTLKMNILKAGFNLNWFEFGFISSLGLEDVKRNTVTIYPNPISENYQIKLNNEQIIKNTKIFDVNGRLVKNEKLNLSNNVYNLSDLKAGIYFLIIETDESSFQKKLIKR